MDKILAEQAFQQSGCTTAECAVKLGKILNVKYLIVGSFGKLMDQYLVTFRMVETETAKVVFSDAARQLSSQSQVYEAIAAMTTRLGRALDESASPASFELRREVARHAGSETREACCRSQTRDSPPCRVRDAGGVLSLEDSR